MSGDQTFGAWLLDKRQQERQDTTGTLARAWAALREARGYNRHTRVKSIRELMSASLGEDWQALHGDESIAAAEAEWRRAGREPVDGAQQLPIPGAEYEARYAAPAPMAVLVVDGHTYELTPGRRYTLAWNPVLREIAPDGDEADGDAPAVQTTHFEQEYAQALASGLDGRIDMAALYELADHNLPEHFDLASLPGDTE